MFTLMIINKIHWLGVGLSSPPGILYLNEQRYNLLVWNRSVDKAQSLLKNKIYVNQLDISSLSKKLDRNDLIVSMLPASMHMEIAELAINYKCHLVTSSYHDPQYEKLEQKFIDNDCLFICECGLDPGIDHLMAHKLVEDFKSSKTIDTKTEISFLSYCGGVPKIPNDFKYKFSWSPLGVLKALKSPSRSLKDFKIFDVNRPWDAITHYTAPLAQPEEFEVYPNRDSIPFMQQYKFDPDWTVKQFVRGTLRLNGWAEAWSDIFKEIETLSGEKGEKRLEEMSEVFWRDNAYGESEPDRVILCVDLKAEKGSRVVWHKTFKMDAWGDHRGTAMARLVSNPVYFAVEAIANKQIEFGVNAATSDPVIVDKWLENIKGLAQEFDVIDHLS